MSLELHDIDPTDGRWLTKAELAAVRRISVASADRLARRQKWRKQPGNDGRVRIFVPPDWLAPDRELPADAASDAADDPRDAETGDPTDGAAHEPLSPTDGPPDIGGILARLDAFQEIVSALRTRAERAETQGDRVQAELEQARKQIEEGMQRIDAERTRADRLGSELDQVRAALAEAEAWIRRPWFRRLRRRRNGS